MKTEENQNIPPHNLMQYCIELNYKWDKRLTSGVAFYNGERITLYQFNNMCKNLGESK